MGKKRERVGDSGEERAKVDSGRKGGYSVGYWKESGTEKTINIKAIIDHLVVKVKDSPTIALTDATWPPTAARCRQVSPRLFLTVTEAPAAISI